MATETLEQPANADVQTPDSLPPERFGSHEESPHESLLRGFEKAGVKSSDPKFAPKEPETPVESPTNNSGAKPVSSDTPPVKDAPQAPPAVQDAPPASNDETAAVSELNEIVNSAHTKPKTRERIQWAIKERADALAKVAEIEKRAAAAEARAKEFEAKSASLPPDVEERLKRGSQLQARYDAENDPELNAKYDTKIQAVEKDIMAIIAPVVPASDLEVIKKVGGFEKFLKEYPGIEAELNNRLTPIDRINLNNALGDKVRIGRDKTAEIDGKVKDFEKYAGENRDKVAKIQGEQAERTKKYEAIADDLKNTHPAFKVPTLPKDATAEQRKSHEEYAKNIENFREIVTKGVVSDNPADRGNLANVVLNQHATIVQKLSELGDLQAKLRTAEERVKALSKAQPTNRTGGTITTPPANPAEADKPENWKEMSAGERLAWSINAKRAQG